MKFGLNDQETQQIHSVFVKYPAIHTALVFGSRAMNTFQPASDIDLALKGDVNFGLLAKVKGELEELPLPYFFDVVNYHDINTTEFKEHIDRHGKIFYLRGWKEVRLGEVAEIIGGGTPKTGVAEYWNGGIPWLSVVDFNNDSRWVYETKKHITKTGLENSSTKLLDAGDLIISARGTVGAFAQLKIPMAFNQSCYGLRAKENSNNDFIFYLLKQNNQQFKKNVHGAVFDTITRETFDQIEILLPPLPEQRAIAAVLSSLDDKIELLHEQNKTLEATAQAIFKEWFVNFNFPGATGKMVESEIGEIPEEWEVGKFEEVVDIRGGTTPSTTNPEFWDGNIAWTSPKDLSNSKEIFLLETEKKITEKGLKQIGSGLLPVGTLLLSSRAPIGYLAISNLEVAINQGYIAFLPNQYFSNYFMFLWLKLNMQEVINAANGSTFLEISKSSFRNIDCAIPNKNILEKFNEIIKPFFEKILKNIIQTQNLSVIRDALLPKLMRGEVRVKRLN